MRNFLIPLIALLAGSTPAIAQDATPAAAQDAVSPEDQALEQLLNQYATVTLGLLIDNRCHQLYPKAADLFAENHVIIKSFMGAIITPEAFDQLNNGILEAANDEVANPCGSFTFDFIQASAQISSTMAYRINILQGKAEPEPDMAVPAVNPPPAAEEAVEESQEPEPLPVPVKEPVQEETPPVQPEVQEPVQEATPPSQPKVQEVKTEPSSGGPVAGETKKELKRRQREELRVLNRKHREEMETFRVNQAAYPDPKAAKKELKARQDEEYYNMLRRHQNEAVARNQGN